MASKKKENKQLVKSIVLKGSVILLATISIVLILDKFIPKIIKSRQHKEQDASQTSWLYGTPHPLENLSLKNVEDKSGVYANSFHLEGEEIFDSNLKPMECLGSLNIHPGDYATQISDKTLVALMDRIKTFEFASEFDAAERYIRESVTYKEICKTQDQYFLLFSSYGEGAASGHGGYDPISLAYTDLDGDLVIVEGNLLVQDSVRNCRSIIGVTEDFIYLSCGWGDGPGGYSSIMGVDYSTEKSSTLRRCDFNRSSTAVYEEECFDSNGVTYYRSPN